MKFIAIKGVLGWKIVVAHPTATMEKNGQKFYSFTETFLLLPEEQVFNSLRSAQRFIKEKKLS